MAPCLDLRGGGMSDVQRVLSPRDAAPPIAGPAFARIHPPAHFHQASFATLHCPYERLWEAGISAGSHRLRFQISYARVQFGCNGVSGLSTLDTSSSDVRNSTAKNSVHKEMSETSDAENDNLPFPRTLNQGSDASACKDPLEDTKGQSEWVGNADKGVLDEAMDETLKDFNTHERQSIWELCIEERGQNDAEREVQNLYNRDSILVDRKAMMSMNCNETVVDDELQSHVYGKNSNLSDCGVYAGRTFNNSNPIEATSTQGRNRMDWRVWAERGMVKRAEPGIEVDGKVLSQGKDVSPIEIEKYETDKLGWSDSSPCEKDALCRDLGGIPNSISQLCLKVGEDIWMAAEDSLQQLEEEVFEQDTGKSPADYSRRADLFGKSAKIFAARKKNCDDCQSAGYVKQLEELKMEGDDARLRAAAD